MRVTVLGTGAWGTALAKTLHENGNQVTLWDIDRPTLAGLREGRNERCLPGLELPRTWQIEGCELHVPADARRWCLRCPPRSFAKSPPGSKATPRSW